MQPVDREATLTPVQVQESQPFLNPEFLKLIVTNPHFNSIITYDYFARHPYEYEHLDYHLYEQVRIALAENFLGSGKYELSYFEQPDGTYLFTNKSFKNISLVEIAQRNIDEKKAKKIDHARENAELALTIALTEKAETIPENTLIAWTSPPGDKQEYKDQVSITYVGQYCGDPKDKTKRHLKVKLFVHTLSLEGHRQLLQSLGQPIQPFGANGFVGHLVELGIGDYEVKFAQIKQIIKALEAQGLVHPEASIKEYLQEHIFHNSEPQIQEFSRYLLTIYKKLYRQKHLNLTQEDVDYLERAYSLGYRSVQKHLKGRKDIVTATEMYKDLQDIEYARMMKERARREILDSSTVWYLVTIFEGLGKRYGSLAAQSTGGEICPAGILAGLDFSITGSGNPLTGPIEYSFGSEPVIEIMKCVNCPFCQQTVDAKVTPSRIICPSCGASAERSAN